MAELPTPDIILAPRLTFDAGEKVLTLVTEPHDNPIARHNGQYERVLENASEMPGYTVAMSGLKSVLSFQIDALRDYPGGDVDEVATHVLLKTLYGTSFYDRPDEHGSYDSVFTPGGIASGGIGLGQKGAIYPGMQRWLNDPERLTDDTARTVLRAMALPYPMDYSKAMSRKFAYTATPQGIFAGTDELRLTTAAESVDLFVSEGELFETWTQEAATWYLPSLFTHASAAWVPTPSLRTSNLFVQTHKEADLNSFLYQLTPSRVGYNAQMLSLMLGAAQIATIVGQQPVATDTLHGPIVARSNSPEVTP